MSNDSHQQSESEDWRGKAIDLARDMGRFVAQFIEGPLEQGSRIYEDKLRYSHWQRQLRYMDQVQKEMKSRGLLGPTKRVPLKIAIPIFQAASIEDEDDLQDRWVALLVNAADMDRGIEVRRTYISILENLGSLEAQILDKLYSVPMSAPPIEFWTCDLPTEIHTNRPNHERPIPSNEVHLALANLARLGCIESAMSWQGWDTQYSAIYQTVLGRAFHAACEKNEKEESP